MALNLAQTEDRMTALGWEAWHMGGGCMAWGRNLPDGSHVLICTESNTLSGDDDDVWIVGRHSEDGDQFTELMVDSLDQALALWDAIPLCGDQRSYPENFWGFKGVEDVRAALASPPPVH